MKVYIPCIDRGVGGYVEPAGVYADETGASWFAAEHGLAVAEVDFVDARSFEDLIARRVADGIAKLRADVLATKPVADARTREILGVLLTAIETDVRDGRWRP